MTTSASKARGSLYERACVAYLRAHGYSQARRNMNQTGSSATRYDIFGCEPFAVECKDSVSLSDAAALDEAVRKADRGIPVLFRKRRNCSVDRSFVIMELRDWVRLSAPPTDRERGVVHPDPQCYAHVDDVSCTCEAQ